MPGCDWDRRSFSVVMKSPDPKKCFFSDCANEGRCEDCNMIQGKFWKYKKQTASRGLKSA